MAAARARSPRPDGALAQTADKRGSEFVDPNPSLPPGAGPSPVSKRAGLGRQCPGIAWLRPNFRGRLAGRKRFHRERRGRSSRENTESRRKDPEHRVQSPRLQPFERRPSRIGDRDT